jgi:cell division protein FtsB
VKPRIVIQGQRRRSRSLPIVLAVMALAIAAPGIYGLARNAALHDFLRSRSDVAEVESERNELAKQLREIKAQLPQLRQEVTDLTRGRDIDRQACGDVQKTLAAEQQEAATLREQLAFYRGVVSPQTARAGLRVHDLRMLPGSAPGNYRYDLVLMQWARQERGVSGRVDLRFIGRDGGAQRSLNLDELTAEGNRGLLFSFRHFQEFTGEFKFPAGFAPQRAVVTLTTDSGSVPRVEQEFEWAQVLEKAGQEKG